jgi:signal transduction histidine kinase
MKAKNPNLSHSSHPSAHVNTSPEWLQVLRHLKVPAAKALGFTKLFLFEFDKDLGESPLLVLRAAIGEAYREVQIPLSETDLTILDEAANTALAVDVSHHFSELQSLVSLVAQREFVSALIAPIHHQRQLLGCLVGCSSRPRRFTLSELSIFSLLASYVAAAVENARLKAETVFRLSEAMSLQAVSSALVEERSLDAILAVIIDEAIRLLNASDALVLLLEEGGDWFRVSARKGRGLAGLINGRLSVRDSLNGLVVTTGQPLVSQDAMTDPRANRERARRLNVHTVVIAPLKIRHRTIGTIAVHNKRDGYFSQSDVEVLCSFANQAAIAIDNARLFSELLHARDEIQQKAQELQELLIQTMHIQEDERRRIAADIHDRVVSRIVGALYEVETCVQLYQRSEDLNEQLQMLKQLLNEAVEKMRTSIYNLWPATLDHIGLIPALRELLSHQERTTGIRHSMRMYGSPHELRPTATIAVYRIVQEALNNIHQHAAASSVYMSIRFSPQRVRITIRDDGKGFDIQSVMLSPPERHFGLIGMRERASGIGGNLHVDSMPGKGSQVTLEIPISEAEFQEEGEWDNASYSSTDS